MKKRNGFVSNSSSSSFIIDANQYSLEQVTNYINVLLEAKALISVHGVKDNIDDFCTIYEVDDMDAIACDDYNHSNYNAKTKMTLKKYKAMEGHTEKKKGIRIDSNGDNSIPWSIQDALERLGTRYHWG